MPRARKPTPAGADDALAALMDTVRGSRGEQERTPPPPRNAEPTPSTTAQTTTDEGRGEGTKEEGSRPLAAGPDLRAAIRAELDTPEGRELIREMLYGGSDAARIALIEQGIGKAKQEIDLEARGPALELDLDALSPAVLNVLALLAARAGGGGERIAVSSRDSRAGSSGPPLLATSQPTENKGKSRKS